MELRCPNCGSTFRAPAEAFAMGPRRVRCRKCSHVWRAEPEPTPVAPAPVVHERPEVEPATELPDLDGQPDLTRDESDTPPAFEETGLASVAPELSRALELPPRYDDQIDDELPPRLQPEEVRRTPAWVWMGWAALILLVVGTVAVLTIAPSQVTAAWPPTQKLYDTVDGLMASAADKAITITVEKSSLATVDGKNRATLLLAMANGGRETLPLPVARVELYAEDGSLIDTVHVRLPGTAIAGGETRREPLILDDVPATLARVRVRAVAEN